MTDTAWYLRMGDIPDIGYEPPEPVDRDSLPGADAVAEVHRFEYDDTVHESLEWHYGRSRDRYSGDSIAPVNRHLEAEREELAALSTVEMLRRLWEALELPGTAEDYRRALWTVSGQLHERRSDFLAISGYETLLWFEARLLQARPDLVGRDTDRADEPARATVSPFGQLIDLYLREGRFRQAEFVDSIAEGFSVGGDKREDLRARRAQLEAEGRDVE